MVLFELGQHCFGKMLPCLAANKSKTSKQK
jgi:hypothetical protein